MSCRKDNVDFPEDLTVELNRTQVSLGRQDTLKLYVRNISQKVKKDSVFWKLDNRAVLTVLAIKGDTVLLKPKAAGQAKISVGIPSLGFESQCIINVHQEDLIRILAIGNSFSEDALEQNLYQLASANEKKIIVANAFYTGADFNFHVHSAQNDIRSYSYRKISASGQRTVTEGMSLKEIIVDDYWDYISFQQRSDDSGIYETFVNGLPKLVDFVNMRNDRSTTKYILHQTWSYSDGSPHLAFNRYKNNSLVMYEAIAGAYMRTQAELLPNAIVVPSGTSIQNYRQNIQSSILTRDTQHLNALGRYIAAATWYYTLFDKGHSTSLAKLYRPSTISQNVANNAEKAVRRAIDFPFSLKEF
ncbi:MULTISPECIES: DUF4886 domain-containing protein [Sphingobacterium]|uniref:DUF4886 domain-containing protein n=1 Tax=Sphingobacterium TaxID=28453 RepID=UPI00082C26CE|nr:DUF4886 domain-containing protein [Sphingobacterium sp. CFCC 11742]